MDDIDKLFDENGFTLTEVLVALAILMIISIAFLTLFTSSYSNITKTGAKNKELYELQKEIEQIIESNDNSGDETLNILFPGISEPIEVKGRIQSEKMTIKNKETSISLFIPNRK